MKRDRVPYKRSVNIKTLNMKALDLVKKLSLYLTFFHFDILTATTGESCFFLPCLNAPFLIGRNRAVNDHCTPYDNSKGGHKLRPFLIEEPPTIKSQDCTRGTVVTCMCITASTVIPTLKSWMSAKRRMNSIPKTYYDPTGYIPGSDILQTRNPHTTY